MKMLLLSFIILAAKFSSAAEVGDYAKFMDQNLTYGTIATYEIRVIEVNKEKNRFRFQKTRYNSQGQEINIHRYSLSTQEMAEARASLIQIYDNCEQYGKRGTLQIKDRTIETCQYRTGQYYGPAEKWISKELPDYLVWAKYVEFRQPDAMTGMVTLIEWGNKR